MLTPKVLLNTLDQLHSPQPPPEAMKFEDVRAGVRYRMRADLDWLTLSERCRLSKIPGEFVVTGVVTQRNGDAGWCLHFKLTSTSFVGDWGHELVIPAHLFLVTFEAVPND